LSRTARLIEWKQQHPSVSQHWQIATTTHEALKVEAQSNLGPKGTLFYYVGPSTGRHPQSLFGRLFFVFRLSKLVFHFETQFQILIVLFCLVHGLFFILLDHVVSAFGGQMLRRMKSTALLPVLLFPTNSSTSTAYLQNPIQQKIGKRVSVNFEHKMRKIESLHKKNWFQLCWIWFCKYRLLPVERVHSIFNQINMILAVYGCTLGRSAWIHVRSVGRYIL